MDVFLDAASWFFLMAGVGVCMIGGVGIIRMPDFYTRSHAASLSDTLGSGLILLGLGIQAGIGLVAVKLLFIFVFIYITSPTSAHALVKAAFSHGVRAPRVEDQRSPSSRENARGNVSGNEKETSGGLGE